MSTKFVTTWESDNNAVDLSHFSKTDEELYRLYIGREIECFLNEEKVTKRSNDKGELSELLNHEYKKIEAELEAERWVELTDDIFFDKKVQGCWIIKSPVICDIEIEAARALQSTEGSIYKPLSELHGIYKKFKTTSPLDVVSQYINNALNDPINRWGVPTSTQFNCLVSLPTNSPVDINMCCGRKILYSKEGIIKGRDLQSGKERELGVCIPFLSMSEKKLSPKHLFLKFIDKGLIPKPLNTSQCYEILLSISHRNRGFTEQNKLNKKTKAATLLLERECKSMPEKEVIARLLNEDKIRADISPYHQKILEDIELGHWSLWPSEEKGSEEHAVELSKPLVARDPNSSINNGIVGIDFGTKSTVVVYQKDNINIHPMRIGTGDLSKEIDASHYENPTIMEFNDLERFINDYQAKANKPNTRWQDLTISHTAQNSMLGCQSSQFNTFLDELKQWAGDKNRKLKIVGKQGKVIDLPPFLELKYDDFNPIEIYAYYLGLYINNQNNGLFLNYILSFPVTYELPIRDKIIKSFERGIQKSLPAQLGSETLAKLKVTKGASEPAAYALVALQAFDFDPCNDERVFYSVFDFGGGTTDFDFGIFREANGAKERRFDYVIEHFGAGGDRYLGGENLLELLAFEIFKKNKNLLLAHKIQFERHPEKDTFAGGEQLVSSSQEAKINTKSLCRVLRPFWEDHKEDALDLSQGIISLSLTDMDAKMHATFELDVDEDELNKILHDRIERGVINFFDALRLAFSNSKTSLQNIDSIKIFLAGNASQSHFVKDIFDKQIALQLEEMGRSGQEESLFEVFPPLGTDKSDVEKPTGKTGVAFGLIEARPGGRIKIIDNNLLQDDIRFKFYLGENRKGHFKAILDREMPYQQWVEYIDAATPDFEFFYTDQPNASSGKMSIKDMAIKKAMIELDITDDEAMVYLRVVSPSKIEYVVAHDDGIKQEKYLNEIKSMELSL